MVTRTTRRCPNCGAAKKVAQAHKKASGTSKTTAKGHKCPPGGCKKATPKKAPPKRAAAKKAAPCKC